MSVRREMTRKLRAMGHSAAKDKDGARVYPGGRASRQAGRLLQKAHSCIVL